MDLTFGDILRQHEVKLKKRLGQHFITDPRLLAFIAQSMVPDDSWVALEIGAGIGTLTKALCQRARFVYAVEIDKDLIDAVQTITKGFANLQWIWDDALNVDLSGGILSSDHPGHPLVLCGNLPYYITSEILYKTLIPRTHFARLAFLVQEEVAERIAGVPGEKSFGRLALWCQYRARVSLGKRIPKGAFLPKPEVTSRLVILEMRSEFPLSLEEERVLDDVSRQVFSLRRKTLGHSLKAFCQVYGMEWTLLIKRMEEKGIDPSKRPEDLPVDTFVCLVREVFSLKR